jgi:glycosyltransferase involved in cell wall biosynthesis
MPQVSVIVPVHNTASYLRACVQSIINQTLLDIEIILVENASTDNSLELCHELAATDHRIRVLHIDEADLSTARNAGVKIAQGAYVGFVDSDDTIQPEMYEQMYTLAKTHDLGLVDCNFYCRYDNRSPRYPYPQDGTVRIMSSKEAVELNLREKISRVVCTMLYKRTLFDTLQFPTHMYYEDRASTFLFMASAQRVGIINKAYYAYYQRTGSINRTKNFRKYRDYAEADCRRLRFITESGMFPTLKEQAGVAFKSGNALARTLGHMVACATTREEKDEVKRLSQRVSLIPRGTALALKQRLILLYIKAWRRFV